VNVKFKYRPRQQYFSHVVWGKLVSEFKTNKRAESSEKVTANIMVYFVKSYGNNFSRNQPFDAGYTYYTHIYIYMYIYIFMYVHTHTHT